MLVPSTFAEICCCTFCVSASTTSFIVMPSPATIGLLRDVNLPSSVIFSFSVSMSKPILPSLSVMGCTVVYNAYSWLVALTPIVVLSTLRDTAPVVGSLCNG